MSDSKAKVLSYVEVMARAQQYYVEGRCFISGVLVADRRQLVPVFHGDVGTTVLVEQRFVPKLA